MARENEIKINLRISHEEFLRRLHNAGFKKENIIRQKDHYFDTKDWFLYEHIAALRLREVDGKDHSFSFKKIFYSPNIVGGYFIEEIRTPFPLRVKILKEILKRVGLSSLQRPIKKSDGLRNFLSKNGYFNEQVMEKTREIFVKGGNEVTIDKVPSVGVVIELECRNENPLEVVKTILKDKEWERTVEGTSFAWLRKVKGLTSHLVNMEKFRGEPDWNVWEWEREYYESLGK
jgi:adenylate cyclase class IV